MSKVAVKLVGGPADGLIRELSEDQSRLVILSFIGYEVKGPDEPIRLRDDGRVEPPQVTECHYYWDGCSDDPRLFRFVYIA